MANIFPSGMKIFPSFSEPDLVVTYAQASGAFAALERSRPRVKIGAEDMAVYVNKLGILSNVAVGQSPANWLPSASLVVSYNSTATYLLRARAIWDHHDIARAGTYKVGLPNAQDLAVRQGIFQMMRNGLLYGFNPNQGEGLLNTANATTVTLPADPFGHTTVQSYDNGAMMLFFLNQIVALKSRMYQSGDNIKNKIVVISPQQEFLYFAEAGVVQVTSYQRPGAGTATIGQGIATVATENGDSFEWYFDDTLIGQASGGNDALLLTMPEIEVPDIEGAINTNIFGDLNPKMTAVNLMYADMDAPMKIQTPTPDGAVTEVHELRVTSGWCIRPEGITIISMPY